MSTSASYINKVDETRDREKEEREVAKRGNIDALRLAIITRERGLDRRR